MPSRYKVSRLGERKWLYRQAATRYLPPALARTFGSIRGRVGPKLGFTAPLARWLAVDGGPLGPSHRWLEPLMARGLLERDGLTRLLTQYARPGERQRELLSLYALSQWIESRD